MTHSLHSSRLPVTVLCTGAIGTLLATRLFVGAPLLSTPLWLLAGFWLHRALREPRDGMPALRVALAALLAYALTLATLGVSFDAVPQPTAQWQPLHAAFGEHPVYEYAGLPWPGVEGSRHAQAYDCVPFTMGVDALLVNFSCWFGLCLLGLRKACMTHLRDLGWLASFAAAIASVFGGWQLICWFD